MTAAPFWSARTDGSVLTLSLSNPPRNMLSFAVLAELESLLGRVSDDDAINVVVLASRQPGYFAAHADLDDIAALGRGPCPDARAWPRTMRRLDSLPQPVVAAIDGQAWGGGLELALACTLRVCSPRAHFAFPETGMGIIPGAGGTQRLARLLGPGRAAELILSGRVFDAREAATLGVVEAVLAGEPFLDSVLAWTAGMAGRPRAALVAGKRAILGGLGVSLEEGLHLEGDLFSALCGDPATAPLVDAARSLYAHASANESVRLDAEDLASRAVRPG